MNTENPSLCPECGKPLPTGSQHGVCPACLMAQALASGTIAPEGAKPAARTAPPTPEEIADKFPQFEILECLGRGGMGVVYKARQKSLNRTVAIKILAPEREHDERFAARFAREAELLAKLSHPHIVTVHDFGEAGGLYYFVMEFVDGVNLRDLLRDGKIEPKQALAIVPPVCDALQYAHEKGIVHRDIKPENLLLDREGRVKIADFGIAALVGAEGERAGTPPYMAPEQSGARPEVDHRADIYALGVVLYEMLTGERPAKEVVAPSRKVQIDVRLDEIVLRALEKKPELRYQQVSEVKTMVETIVSESQRSEVGIQKPVVEAVKPERPSRFPRIAGFVFFLLAYFGLLLLLATTAGTLPPRVASHFGAEGRPNGWMSREFYLAFTGCLPLLFGGFAVVVSWLVRRLPARFVSLPRTDYWLTPERRPEVAAFLRRRMFWLAGLVTVFFAGLHLLTVHANRSEPPHLSMDGLLPLVMAFLISVLVWTICLIMRLAEVDKPLSPRGSQRDEAQTGGIRKSQMVRLVEVLFSCTLTAPLAIRLVNVSALGFLGFLAFLGYVPLPGMHRCFGFAGFSGFFGLIGLAFLVEFAQRRKKPGSTQPGASQREEVQSEKTGNRKSEIAPRFSRTAIAGACWAACFIMAAVVFACLKMGILPPLSRKLVFVTLLPLAVTAPLGATILGWVAVSQIRHSAGKLYGLWLAVFDGLLFPLLVLDFVGVKLVLYPVEKLLRPLAAHNEMAHFLYRDAPLIIFIPVLVAILVVDWLIIRRVWRAVNQSAGASEPPAQKTGRFWRFIIIVFVVVPTLGLLGNMAIVNWNKKHQADESAKRQQAEARQTASAPYQKMDWLLEEYPPLAEFQKELNRPEFPLMTEAVGWAEPDGKFHPVMYLAQPHPRGASEGPPFFKSPGAGKPLRFNIYRGTNPVATANRFLGTYEIDCKENEAGEAGLFVGFALSPTGRLSLQVWAEKKGVALEGRRLRPPEPDGKPGGRAAVNQPYLRVTLRVLDVPATFDDAQLLRPSGLLDSGEVKILAAPFVVVPSGSEGEIQIPGVAGREKGFSHVLSGRTKTLYVKPTLKPGSYWVDYQLDGLVREAGADAKNHKRQGIRSDSLQLGELQIMESNGLPNGRRQLAIISAEMEVLKVDASGKTVPMGTNAAAPELFFGPVVERVVNEMESGLGHEGLRLESGELVSIPKGNANQWLKNTSVDLLVGRTGREFQLIIQKGILRDMDNADWENATPEILRNALGKGPGRMKPGKAKLGWEAYDWTGGELPATFALHLASGTDGIIQVLGSTSAGTGVKIRYKLLQQTNSGPASTKPRVSTDQIIVEDLALQMIVAIREKDDAKLRALASDRIKGWANALPQFAVELREHYRQSTGNEAFDLRASESLVDGDLAAVRCTGPKELEGKCLVLFFVKTADGWRNHSLRASMENVPLAQHLENLKKQIEKAEGSAPVDALQTLASQPPVVVETLPVSGARDVAPGVADIRVRFSKPMTDNSWSWSSAWENSAPEFIGQPHYEADGRTCMAKVKLEPGRSYAFWLNSGNFGNFRDSDGRPAVPYLLIFQTKQK